jgi:effector-binding domain-containing protein
MLETPEITRSVAQPTAMIHLTTPRTEIASAMDPAITELLTALASQGITPSGPMLSYHRRIEPENFDVEISFPVGGPIAETGRVKAGQLPETTVARTVYHGAYEGLGNAWKEFDGWITASGHTRAGNLWERYVVGPESTPDPAEWRTELNCPLLES